VNWEIQANEEMIFMMLMAQALSSRTSTLPQFATSVTSYAIVIIAML
jgi:hypothetical protein